MDRDGDGDHDGDRRDRNADAEDDGKKFDTDLWLSDPLSGSKRPLLPWPSRENVAPVTVATPFFRSWAGKGNGHMMKSLQPICRKSSKTGSRESTTLMFALVPLKIK